MTHYPFKKIFSGLKSLSYSTELLELCGWDEEEFEKISELVSFELASITIPNHISEFDQIWKPVENRLYNQISDDKIEVIKKMILLEWDLIKKYYIETEDNYEA